MLKKFTDWRENLTWKQVKTIMWRSGIVLATVLVILLVSNLDYLLYERLGEDKIPAWLFWTILSIFGLFMIEFYIYFLLDGISKQACFEADQMKEKAFSKLKEDEFTQVYLKQRCRFGVSKIILDVYDRHDIEYFAKKQGDGIYVISKENGEKLEKYLITNGRFFDSNFQFEKEE